METMTNTSLFGVTKEQAIQKGIQNRDRFLQIVDKLSTIRNEDKYPHNFIYGYPGIGKSYEIKNRLENSGTKYVMVTGNVSMFAFGVQLAVINFLNPNQERIIVFCDDVDTLVANETSCNMLKSALHGPKVFTYEKSLQSQWSNMSELQKEAIKYHQDEGKMGFQVPTSSMSFLIVSNIQLPTDDEVRKAREKSKSKSSLMAHKNAIRSRCMVQDFSLSNAELWGWIADVVLNTNCLAELDLSVDQKESILDFVWDNWESLTERSIRLIEKMAIIMQEYPDTHKSIWEIDFLK
jgi:aerobic-type carbon monoxide dehydrogenase small subunit (CoxS/CutS family)